MDNPKLTARREGDNRIDDKIVSNSAREMIAFKPEDAVERILTLLRVAAGILPAVEVGILPSGSGAPNGHDA